MTDLRPGTSRSSPPGAQINLLGVPDLPEDLELGPVQREVMRFVRQHGSVSKDEAGALAHAHRGKHQADEVCAFCSIDSRSLLKALVDRHRLERGRDGMFRIPDSRGPGDLPENF